MMSHLNSILNNVGMALKYLSRIKHILFVCRLRFSSAKKRGELMRKKMYFCGRNVELYTTYFGTEPFLISIHDNVVCAANVRFINHDVSCYRIAHYLNIPKNEVDSIGSIELFENCFIGAYTILMPNCSVGKNSIIAAGSIVTKHIPDGEVWGGCPAKFIMTVDEYAQKILNKSQKYPWINDPKNITNKDYIKVRQNYFFEKK